MLKLHLSTEGIRCRVELDGVDISKHLRAVSFSARVGELTTASLEYLGAVVVEGEPGELKLEQAPLFVECQACHKTVQGEKAATIVRNTTLSSEWETSSVVERTT